MTQKPTYHFISHTHWDREWYLTFEQFRFRLVRLMDNLLELLEHDTDFKHFHLDAQTIVLEDYLELRPSQRPRLEVLIRAGRILIGPWYVQNDLYLTSAESTVRNLLEGIWTARDLGGEMRVGYLPDHFGLIGQMPQILRGMGIDNSVFGRGYDLHKHGLPHCFWRAPDGSEVVGIFMPHWYNNAQRLPTDRGKLERLFARLSDQEARVSTVPHYLMMNGVDHLEAQEDLSEVLNELRKLYSDSCTILHNTLPNYVQAVDEAMRAAPGAFPTHTGELREGGELAVLGGTLSSRVYLKQANLRCHDLLEKWAEPLSVWCALLELEPVDREMMRHLWKRYMHNHPHDSICGCGQDAVHEHMMDRFALVEELAEEIIESKLALLAQQVSVQGFEPHDQKLLVVNTSQCESSAVIRSSLYFLADDGIETFELLAPDGTSAPYRLCTMSPSRIQVTSPINLPGVLEVKRADIEWQPRVPPLSYAAYRVRVRGRGWSVASDDLGGAHVLENEALKVCVHEDGTFDLTDKRSGKTLVRLGHFEDAGDRGNLYVFQRVPGEAPLRWARKVEVAETHACPLYARLRYCFTWDLPAGLSSDLESRSSATVPCDFEVTLQLDAGATHLRYSVTMNNRANDHRVRLTFGLDGIERVWAGGQFDAVERAWDEGCEYARQANAQPFWKWVAARYPKGGLAVYARGLHDYEVIAEGNTLALTLLRNVETIGERSPLSLESDRQPLAQCPGTFTFELALRPISNESATRLYQEAESFHQGVRVKSQPADETRWAEGRPWVQEAGVSGIFHRPNPHADKARLPSTGALLELQGDALVSAIKGAERGEQFVLRIYNVEPRASELHLGFPASLSAVPANLLEEPLSAPEVLENGLRLTLPPKQIATYLLDSSLARSPREDQP